MRLTRFEALAAACGSDIARWPEDEQAAARALAAQDPRAQAALRQAAQLDGWLEQARLPLPAGSTERLLAATLARTQAAPRTAPAPAWRLWQRWWPAALLAGAALAGGATARERPQWLGLANPAPAAGSGVLASTLDIDGSRF
jgi:hypothetical protein